MREKTRAMIYRGYLIEVYQCNGKWCGKIYKRTEPLYPIKTLYTEICSLIETSQRDTISMAKINIDELLEA